MCDNCVSFDVEEDKRVKTKDNIMYLRLCILNGSRDSSPSFNMCLLCWYELDGLAEDCTIPQCAFWYEFYV